MGVVVIIGFSCTGKTTMCKDLAADPDCKAVQFADSDALVSASAGGHIYQMFLDNSRKQADLLIEQEELKFLQTYVPSQYCVIAAGPILPLRTAEFQAFLNRTNARCVLLTLTAEYAEYKLLERQNNIAQSNPLAANHANFGSWNVPHLMEPNTTGTGYSLISDQEKRVSNVRDLINSFVPRYQQFSGHDKYFVGDEKRRQAAYNRIKELALR